MNLTCDHCYRLFPEGTGSVTPARPDEGILANRKCADCVAEAELRRSGAEVRLVQIDDEDAERDAYYRTGGRLADELPDRDYWTGGEGEGDW